MRNRQEIIKLLGVFIEVIEELSESEYEQLLNGSGHLVFTPSVAKRNKAKISEISKASQEELQALIIRLQECENRDEARELIHRDSRMSLKDNLEQLARLLAVHVNKHDKRDTVEDKIIESVIGVKLRSEAIRGLNLKNSGNE